MIPPEIKLLKIIYTTVTTIIVMLDKISILVSFIFAIIMCFGSSYAAQDNDLFYSGDVTYDIKNTYNAGDNIETTLVVANKEKFPLIDAYVIVDITQGCENPTYPSQDSDCDNVFFEKIIRNLNIDPLSQVSIPFSYKLPHDLKSGTYRMDVYLRTKKTPMLGMAHIFLPGRHSSFKVTGSGTEPSVKILRTQTEILDTTGPVGPPAEPSSKVTGSVFIENSKTSQVDGLSLFVGVCSWDDTGCESYVWKNTYPFSITASETKKIDFSFNAPKKPDAYAVRLEVKDKNGETKSLYRSRLIVTGKTAKIRKLWIGKRYYNTGETVEINTMLFGSPDHYTYPVVNNANLLVSLRDLNNGKTVFQNTEVIPELSTDAGLISKKFEFVSKSALSRFEVCAQITSENNGIYDRHCIEVDSAKFSSNVRKYSLNEKKFDTETMKFSANLCAADGSDMPVSANIEIDISDLNNRNSVMSAKLNINKCSPLEFAFKSQTDYRMLINDEDVNRQYRFEFTSPKTEKSGHPGENEKDEKDEDDKKDEDKNYLIIAAIAVVLIAVILAYAYNRIKNGENIETET